MFWPALRGRRATLHGKDVSATFSLRPLDLNTDLDVIHSWMNDPEVARFWQKAWPKCQVADYLRTQQDMAHSSPFVGELDGRPTSYWELYRADLDPVAQYYDAHEYDAGLHLLLGAECRGQGFGAGMLDAVATWQLAADPRTQRVIGEPNADNERVIRALERAGFVYTTDLDLPTKRAALLIRDRAA